MKKMLAMILAAILALTAAICGAAAEENAPPFMIPTYFLQRFNTMMEALAEKYADALGEEGVQIINQDYVLTYKVTDGTTLDYYNLPDNVTARFFYPDEAHYEQSAAYLTAVWTQMAEAFKDCEKLRNYISNGGAISMLLPPCETKGRFKNIESLLAMFELGMNYNKVTEKSAMLHPGVKLISNMIPADITAEDDPRLTEILENYIKVSYPYPTEDASEDLTTDINKKISDGTYFPYVNASRSFYELVSDSAMIEKFSIIENLTLEQDSSKYTTISTPMGGDESTEAEAKGLSNTPLVMGYYSYNKQTGAKLIVLGSDEMIDDNTLTIATYGTRMLTLFSNTWLYNSDIDMGITDIKGFASIDSIPFDEFI